MQQSATENELDVQLEVVRQSIGHTPLYDFSSYVAPGNKLYAKQEWQQLSGSVKARAAFNIIRNAIKQGRLSPATRLLDATSGNTGIAYAAIGKALGIGITLCLPENASPERKKILSDLGAEIIFTSKFEGTDGAQQIAKDLANKFPGKYFYADQYSNDNNWKAHYYSTAIEIFEAVPGITHFVAAIGTGGTFTGTARRLKELNPSVQLIALQPDFAIHGLEGWKHLETAVVPRIYDETLADETILINTNEAYDVIRKVYLNEGLLLSPSSAANLLGAIKVSEKIKTGNIVTILPDNADKYADIIQQLNIL